MKKFKTLKEMEQDHHTEHDNFVKRLQANGGRGCDHGKGEWWRNRGAKAKRNNFDTESDEELEDVEYEEVDDQPAQPKKRALVMGQRKAKPVKKAPAKKKAAKKGK